jgi:hypothetical protein
LWRLLPLDLDSVCRRMARLGGTEDGRTATNACLHFLDDLVCIHTL